MYEFIEFWKKRDKIPENCQRNAVIPSISIVMEKAMYAFSTHFKIIPYLLKGPDIA